MWRYIYPKIWVAMLILIFIMTGWDVSFQTEYENNTTSYIVRAGPANSSWPMFMGNPRHTGQSSYSNTANPGGLKWKITMGPGTCTRWSLPALGPKGTIYLGLYPDGMYSPNFYAIYPNGTVKWAISLSKYTFPSTPAIDAEGTIYVCCDGFLYAIKPDGDILWSKRTHTFMSSPTIGENGTIYVGSEAGYLYAIQPDGTTIWKFETGGSIISSPAVGAEGTIYIGSSDGYLYAVEPNGTLRWKFYTDRLNNYYSPIVGNDGTIYYGPYAINSDGTLKFKKDVSLLAIDRDETIYALSGLNTLYAFSSDGYLKWSFKIGFKMGDWSQLSSPAIGGDGTIYVASYSGFLYAINPDGTLKWVFKFSKRTWSSPVIGNDGSVYIGVSNYLYAINTGAPSPPMNVKAKMENGYVRVEWDRPSADGGSPIMEYRIYRTLYNPTSSLPDCPPHATVNNTTCVYIDRDVENGMKYYYYITAVNTLGESERSSAVWIIIPAWVPTPPQNLTVEEGKYPILHWEPPENDGSSALSTYRIYRSEDGVNFSLLTEVSDYIYYYTDEDVEPGKTYWYYVTAVNDVGESDSSNLVKATVPYPEEKYDDSATPIALLISGALAGCVCVHWYAKRRKRRRNG